MSMQLSPEDSLRLNVLLAQPLQAVRIDESKPMVYALSERGEARVALTPTCRSDRYVKWVRELFSSHFLGSPSGYPVYLRRWTRMGQAKADSLEKLLLLGEPEAVVAVAQSPALTDELARRVWWCGQSADNARRMLQKPEVAQGEMGRELAEFLLEFLPFEESPQAMIDSIEAVLQPDLISGEQSAVLWKKAKRKTTYYVGFLRALPDDLPMEAAAHEKWPELQKFAEQENPYLALLEKVFSAEGQAFLKTIELVMKKPANQDEVVSLMNAIGDYFSAVRPYEDWQRQRSLQVMQQDVDILCEKGCSSSLAAALQQLPDFSPQLKTIMIMSLVSEYLVNPIFGQSDAIGSLMRRKLEPVTQPLLLLCGQLR